MGMRENGVGAYITAISKALQPVCPGMTARLLQMMGNSGSFGRSDTSKTSL